MENNTYKKKEYVQSDAVNQAYTALQAQQAAKPGAYASKYQAGIDDTINKIMNREKFSYDLNGDALYQQYKDKYTTQGKLAMMDTMGQAATMTGGFGSSYSQAAGQQAYQGYMQQLNDVVPELYQMAYDRYNQEGQDLYNQYALLSQQEEADYGKYRDTVADHRAERDYLAGRYDSERGYDYGKYVDDTNFDYGIHRDSVSDSQWNQSLEYQKQQDAIAKDQWDKTFDYQKQQDAVANEQWDKTFEYQQSQDAIANEQWDKQFDLAAQQHKLNELKFESAEEQQAWENLMYETEYADSRKDKATAEATDLALKWLSMGVMPEQDVLDAAGISGESAQAMVDAIEADDTYNKSQDAMAQAGAKAEMMIKSGVMPDAETIKAWGVPEETVQAMVDVVNDAEVAGIDERNRAEAREIAMTLIASGVDVPREISAISGLSEKVTAALQKAYQATAKSSTGGSSVSDLTKISDTTLDLLENFGEPAATAYANMMVTNGFIDHDQLKDILDLAGNSINGGEFADGADVTVEDIGGTTPEPEQKMKVEEEDEEEEKKKKNPVTTGGGGGTSIKATHKRD